MQTLMTGRERQRGASMLELVIFAFISVLVLSGVYEAYSNFSRGTVRTQVQTRTQDDARRVLEQTLRELRMAGYGLPKASNPAPMSAITAAAPDAISFLTGDGVPSTTVTAAAAAGSNILSVAASSAFQVGNAVYVADQATYHAATVTAVGASLTISPPLPVNFATGTTVTRQPRQIAYSYANGTMYRDVGAGAGPQPWLADLTSLTFRYYDGNNNPVVMPGGNASTIRRIEVVITASGAGQAPGYTVKSETWIRN
jgi:Tfp pilus assembly protein PilW